MPSSGLVVLPIFKITSLIKKFCILTEIDTVPGKMDKVKNVCTQPFTYKKNP